MKRLMVCIMIGTVVAPAVAQECAERFHPFNDIVMSTQGMPLMPGDEVWIEFSTDCFHIPQSTWGGEVRFDGQEDFSAEDLAATGAWFDISRAPADAIPGAVLGADGMSLAIDSFQISLDNGRVRSVAMVPPLLGRPTIDGPPVSVGDELFFNWYLNLSEPVGVSLAALLPESRLRTISFAVAVPEPTSTCILPLTAVVLLSRRKRSRR